MNSSAKRADSCIRDWPCSRLYESELATKSWITPTVTIEAGLGRIAAGGTLALTAAVASLRSAGVSWSVDGVDRGNATVGTIDDNGVYNAPMTIPPAGSVTIQATSLGGAAVVGTVTLDIVPAPIPVGGGLVSAAHGGRVYARAAGVCQRGR